MNNILVLGGTGYVGRAVCERLVERSGGGGGRVVVPTRRLSHGAWVRSLPTLELVEANVHDDAALAQLLARVDAVVNLVAILHGSRAEFERVHVELPRRLARACAGAGVRRLVHVSALGVGPNSPSNYLRSKTEGEAVLQAAGLDLTLLRPSVIFGAEDQFLNVFAKLQALAPVIRWRAAARVSSPSGSKTWPAPSCVVWTGPTPSARPTNWWAPRPTRCRSWCGWPGAGRATSGRRFRCPSSPAACRQCSWNCCRARR